MGRDLERHQPDGRDAETMQVVETAHQALEVTNAVAVGIHVGSNRQAIDHRVLVPKVVDHRATRWSDRSHQKTHRRRFCSLGPDRTSGEHPKSRDTAINRDIYPALSPALPPIATR